MGEKGGKNDMDRVGLFQEMGYITINDRYKRGFQESGKLPRSFYHVFIMSWNGFFFIKLFNTMFNQLFTQSRLR